jgi:hypothetical protein
MSVRSKSRLPAAQRIAARVASGVSIRALRRARINKNVVTPVRGVRNVGPC